MTDTDTQDNTGRGRMVRIRHYRTVYLLPPQVVPSTLAGELVDSFCLGGEKLPTAAEVHEYVTDHPHLFEGVEHVFYLSRKTGKNITEFLELKPGVLAYD